MMTSELAQGAGNGNYRLQLDGYCKRYFPASDAVPHGTEENDMKLTGAQVQVRNPKWKNKGAKSQASRSGYVDENRQVYLPPSNAKKLTEWKKKLSERGLEFA